MAKKRTLDKDLSFMKTFVRNKYVRNYEDLNRQKIKNIPKKFRSKNQEIQKIEDFQKLSFPQPTPPQFQCW